MDTSAVSSPPPSDTESGSGRCGICKTRWSGQGRAIMAVVVMSSKRRGIAYETRSAEGRWQMHTAGSTQAVSWRRKSVVKVRGGTKMRNRKRRRPPFPSI